MCVSGRVIPRKVAQNCWKSCWIQLKKNWIESNFVLQRCLVVPVLARNTSAQIYVQCKYLDDKYQLPSYSYKRLIFKHFTVGVQIFYVHPKYIYNNIQLLLQSPTDIPCWVPGLPWVICFNMVTMATMAAMGPAVVPLALAGPLVVGLTKLLSVAPWKAVIRLRATWILTYRMGVMVTMSEMCVCVFYIYIYIYILVSRKCQRTCFALNDGKHSITQNIPLNTGITRNIMYKYICLVKSYIKWCRMSLIIHGRYMLFTWSESQFDMFDRKSV